MGTKRTGNKLVFNSIVIWEKVQNYGTFQGNEGQS